MPAPKIAEPKIDVPKSLVDAPYKSSDTPTIMHSSASIVLFCVLKCSCLRQPLDVFIDYKTFQYLYF